MPAQLSPESRSRATLSRSLSDGTPSATKGCRGFSGFGETTHELKDGYLGPW
jgi:hypothetical protein